MREILLQALRDGYTFPGWYPIVIIARNERPFEATLISAVHYEQDGADYAITRRESRQRTYASFHVDVFVTDAETALDRKEFLSRLPGVLMTL